MRWRLSTLLWLVLIGIGICGSIARADESSGLIGNWTVQSFEQKKSRMSPHCQPNAEADVTTVPESQVEIVPCDDPGFAAQKTGVETFIKAVNQVYAVEKRPLYPEAVSGLCAVVRATTAKWTTDVCNPSEKLRQTPLQNLTVVWNIKPSSNPDWPLRGDSYSPSSGYGAISCFKKPENGKVTTKGCRRWNVELPVVGAAACDCGCTVVCEEYTWRRD